MSPRQTVRIGKEALQSSGTSSNEILVANFSIHTLWGKGNPGS